MAYKRKTVDRWDIETNYGYGWETECSEYTWGEAKAQAICYRKNIRGDVRVVKRREKIADENREWINRYVLKIKEEN